MESHILSEKETIKRRMLQELMTKSGYPPEMLEVDYPIYCRGHTEYADIAVAHWNNEEQEPYILIAVITDGESLQNSMKRLRAYISSLPTVRFTAVTDGVCTVIEKRQGRTYLPVSRFPAYEKMNHRRYWQYEYVNLKNQCSYEYLVDRENEHNIQIRQKGCQETLNPRKYYSVPIIGTVAAGALKPAVQEYMGEMHLPEEFGVGREENFALQVHGDSMIDFDILPGDYVIIKKQAFAASGDIVVAGKHAEDEVTLKKYQLSGSSVILLPGNSDYESIVLPIQETYINGVVIGVMKKENK